MLLSALAFATASLGRHAPHQHYLQLAAIDCHAFQSGGADLDFPLYYGGSTVMARLSSEPGGKLRGVVADGVSLVLLRATSGSDALVHFTAGGVGGWLYPLFGVPFRKAGSATLDVQTQMVAGEHIAYALYRPPTSYGPSKSPSQPINFQARVGDDKQELSIGLVRPPVVLVHGTYDNPAECWEKVDPEDDSKVSMRDFLLQNNHRPFSVDWESTNGSKDPSDFRTNQKAVYDNLNGIRAALTRYRSNGIAITQVDVVCHSQGGVITRVYARGFPLNQPMEIDHAHFRNPEACAKLGCWYHRAENYNLGNIHRLVTISSTHRGSDVCRLFNAYQKYIDGHGLANSALAQSVWLDLFCTYVNRYESGIRTGGFYDQTPASQALRDIGPTPVPSHAIACVADDHDVETGHGGSYYNRLWKIWVGTPEDVMVWALGHLSPPNKADDANGLQLLIKVGANRATIVKFLRNAVFNGDENDVTVAMESSFGGMAPSYRTRLPHVLHGWAPRYQSVQKRVLELLESDGDLFDKNGFPNSYTGSYSMAANFLTDVPRGNVVVQENTGISGYWLFKKVTSLFGKVTEELVPAFVDAQADGVNFTGELYSNLTIDKLGVGRADYYRFKKVSPTEYEASYEIYAGGPWVNGSMTLSQGTMQFRFPPPQGETNEIRLTWLRPNSEQLAKLRASLKK